MCNYLYPKETVSFGQSFVFSYFFDRGANGSGQLCIDDWIDHDDEYIYHGTARPRACCLCVYVYVCEWERGIEEERKTIGHEDTLDGTWVAQDTIWAHWFATQLLSKEYRCHPLGVVTCAPIWSSGVIFLPFSLSLSLSLPIVEQLIRQSPPYQAPEHTCIIGLGITHRPQGTCSL